MVLIYSSKSGLITSQNCRELVCELDLLYENLILRLEEGDLEAVRDTNLSGERKVVDHLVCDHKIAVNKPELYEGIHKDLLEQFLQIYALV